MTGQVSTDPKGWAKTTLGNLVKVGRGSSPRPIHDYLAKTGIPWVKIADATASNTRFIKETKQFIKEDGRSTSVKPGDLIVSNSATPGIPKIMAIDACVHDGWLVFDEYKNVDKWFLFYFFLDYRKKLSYSASGSVFDNLKTDIVREVIIKLPPLAEQKSIIKVLSILDDKIELLRTQNKTLETVAEVLFKEWFIENGHLKIDSGEWSEKPLGEVTNIGIGRTPPRKEHEWFSFDEKDNKWISIKDLGSCGAFILNTAEFLTNEAINSFNIPIIPKDTVILSFKMTVGRVAITGEDMLSNEAIAHFKFNDDTPFPKEFLYLFLKVYNYEQLGSTSTIVTSVNSRMIKDILIPIPDKGIMVKFNRMVEKVFKKIRNNQTQIQTLTRLRGTLLPKLMRGEIRVKKETYNG
ncbi:MAG: restriction endonuclease subunit S [Candidatus Theseobacter exili]|nr:restriction endonuclease subunit S [Candidatus Theseobacter exili]